MHLYFSQKPIIINTMKFLQFDEMLALKQVLPANSKPAQQITSYIQLNDIYSKKLFSTYLSDLKLYAFEDCCPPSITKKADEINQSRALLNEWDDIIKSWGDVVSAGEEGIANKTLPYLLEILKEPYPFQIPISRMEFNYKLETSYQHFLIRPENTPYDTELPFVELYAKYINIKKIITTLTFNGRNFKSPHSKFIGNLIWGCVCRDKIFKPFKRNFHDIMHKNYIR